MAAIYISILNVKLWSPLSRTHRLDALWDNLTPMQADIVRAEFAEWVSELLKHQVRRAIKTQQFPVKYAPLSKTWRDKKKDANWKPGFWQASEFLYNNIRVWHEPSTDRWHVGFPKGLKHKFHDREELAAIANRLEKGDKASNLPPRPLFTPLGQSISKDIVKWFIEFSKLHHPEYLDFIQTVGSDPKETFQTLPKR